MALQELDEYEDDYVFLSDVEDEAEIAPSITFTRTVPGGPTKGNDNHGPDTMDLRKVAPSSTSLQPQQQQQQQQAHPRARSTQTMDEDEESDLEDIEEIEYGYDNDTLLIMPAMLRDYSHHATNYHPELWRSPIPGSYSPQPSLVQCRQEDRMLDRAELLKTSIPPTTCGICFETFTTFELNPQKEQETTTTDEISSRVQFAMSFTARLARSFALTSNNSNCNKNNNSSFIPGESASASTSADGPSNTASSSSYSASPSLNPHRSSTATIKTTATATPSISSRDIGIVMPCEHGLCLSCLQSFLTNAATQNPQARFPTLCPQPGCRTPIPTESAELVLDPETLEIWYRKLAEIHVANKVCCPRPECRSIIDLDDRDGTAVTCPDCRRLTCEQYQNHAQGGQSEEDRAMLQLVRDRHWRHCPSCRFVIEKQQGCNHMVCHCGQSFCYKCGHPWNEMDARCSQDCENVGIHEDLGLDCVIM
ncbi:hypothetical protein BGX28_005472 [Mortierella sp. GBA30]|nr:hypothetical protein BGX28_005472 [Mortierella sp. GBA30]